MPFNIDTFRAGGLQMGGARPALFDILLTPPAIVPGAGGSAQYTLLAKAGSVPPAIVGDVQIPYFGRMVKYSGDREYPDWDITVLNDEDFVLRRILEAWSNEMNTSQTNQMTTQTHPLNYKASAIVTQYSKNNVPIASYQFDGLWPKVVDTMQLDWGNQNSIQEFNVTFAYDYWIPIAVQGVQGAGQIFDPNAT
jgi:hypothetical protein